MTVVRLAAGEARATAIARLAALWGEPMMLRGTAYRFADCEIFIAGDVAGLAALSLRDAPVAELVALNALAPRAGTGTALLAACAALARDTCHTLRVVTTNDNLDALRFYQRRGFVLSAVRFGAVAAARAAKPNIPLTGDYGITLRDEFDLVLAL